MRSALLDTLSEDYVRTARAKGLTRRQVMWRHALRNAMIPVLTIIGLQFSFLLAGAIIIENVFFLPGLGRLVFQAISQRDLIMVESVVMLLVFAVILDSRDPDFLYFLMTGKLAFNWFSKSVTQASNSLVSAKGLIGNINVTKTLFPLASVQEGLYNQIAVFLLMFSVLYNHTHVYPQ